MLKGHEPLRLVLVHLVDLFIFQVAFLEEFESNLRIPFKFGKVQASISGEAILSDICSSFDLPGSGLKRKLRLMDRSIFLGLQHVHEAINLASEQEPQLLHHMHAINRAARVQRLHLIKASRHSSLIDSINIDDGAIEAGHDKSTIHELHAMSKSAKLDVLD